jgi:hypothetical protein
MGSGVLTSICRYACRVTTTAMPARQLSPPSGCGCVTGLVALIAAGLLVAASQTDSGYVEAALVNVGSAIVIFLLVRRSLSRPGVVIRDIVLVLEGAAAMIAGYLTDRFARDLMINLGTGALLAVALDQLLARGLSTVPGLEDLHAGVHGWGTSFERIIANLGYGEIAREELSLAKAAVAGWSTIAECVSGAVSLDMERDVIQHVKVRVWLNQTGVGSLSGEIDGVRLSSGQCRQLLGEEVLAEISAQAKPLHERFGPDT